MRVVVQDIATAGGVSRQGMWRMMGVVFVRQFSVCVHVFTLT